MGDFTRIGARLVPTVSKYVTFTSPGVYTIRATGRHKQGGAVYAVTAVVQIIGKKGYRIIYWKDQETIRRKAA